jgi:deoxyribose-phosphate aldolase
MREDQLVELIAQQVRARLMAGGQGPGYTRAATGGCQNHSGPSPEALRSTPCEEEPSDESCGGCGMCVTRRAGDVQALVEIGASRVGAATGTGGVAGGLAGMIDHTLLKPEATREQLKALAEEARTHKFATVCVNSANVRLMKQFLKGSNVPVCAVVGFPLGAMAPKAKAFETKEAVRCGAREIDMVLNIGALLSGDYALVGEDIQAVVDAARPVPVKVILETSKLDYDQKVIACALSKSAGAAFVKTSTGFGGGGATAEDVALMRRIVGNEMGVKASGGVRSRADVEKMVAAGANRVGASASVTIVTGGRASGGY